MVAIRSATSRIAQKLSGLDLTGIRVRLIDAENHVLQDFILALILQGKDKPIYRRDRDLGDVCVVVNASKVRLTGKKWDEKVYRWHTGYPGGLREKTARQAFRKRPEEILWRSISGMLPKNRLLRQRLNKLLIFPGSQHNIADVELTKWYVPPKSEKRQREKGHVPV